MCPFTGTEGTKDTLEALEKGLKSERQAAQSRLARNTGCRRCSVGVHARRELERDWCGQMGVFDGVMKNNREGRWARILSHQKPQTVLTEGIESFFSNSVKKSNSG